MSETCLPNSWWCRWKRPSFLTANTQHRLETVSSSHVIARWGAVASCWTLITRMIIVPHSFRQVKTVVHRDLVWSRVWSLFVFNCHNRGEFLFVSFSVVPTKNAPFTPPFSSLAPTLDIISCFCIWKSSFNEHLSGEITPSFPQPPLVLSISYHPLWEMVCVTWPSPSLSQPLLLLPPPSSLHDNTTDNLSLSSFSSFSLGDILDTLQKVRAPSCTQLHAALFPPNGQQVQNSKLPPRPVPPSRERLAHTFARASLPTGGLVFCSVRPGELQHLLKRVQNQPRE